MSKRQVARSVQKPKRQRRSENINVDWEDNNDFEDGSDSDDHSQGGSRKDVEEDDPYANETAEEKRVRLAKGLLARYDSLKGNSDDESEEEDESKVSKRPAPSRLDAVSKQIHRDLLSAEGRLRLQIADTLDSTKTEEIVCSRSHRFAITAVALSDAEDFVLTASKDCTIIKWDVVTGKRIGRFPGHPGARKHVESTDNSIIGHTDQVLSLALTSDGRYAASAGRDKVIKVWDVRANKLIDTYTGHRDVVSGLVFRKGSHTLFSASHDRSVRVWNVDEGAFVESLFGHVAQINAIDSMFKERAVTCSMDKSIRFWKIPEESQLILQGMHMTSIDCIKMVDEVHFVTGGQDGILALWTSARKKPTSIVRDAHSGKWIVSVATLRNSDLIASGSSDGFIKLWKLNLDEGRIIAPPVGTIEVPGFVNSLAFGPTGRILVAGCGQEHRLGRWERDTKGSNRLHIFRLSLSHDLLAVNNLNTEDNEESSDAEDSGEESDE